MDSIARQITWQPDQIQVDQLTDAHLGKTVQVPGQRGVLQGYWTDEIGLIAVMTTVGIAHYLPDTPAWVEAADA